MLPEYNTHSVKNKTLSISDYVTSHDYDIMCLPEIWLRSDIDAVTEDTYKRYIARANDNAQKRWKIWFYVGYTMGWPLVYRGDQRSDTLGCERQTVSKNGEVRAKDQQNDDGTSSTNKALRPGEDQKYRSQENVNLPTV